ncbi:uncharacterized protein METZ01_LOCUS472671, partial [marine metagenome]
KGPPAIRIGDEIELPDTITGEINAYKVTGLKKYDYEMGEENKFAIFVKEYGKENTVHKLSKGEELFFDFYSKNDGRWISYYTEVTHSELKSGRSDELSNQFLNILNCNGIYLNNYKKDYIVIGIDKNTVHEKISSGSRLKSINRKHIDGEPLSYVHRSLKNSINKIVRFVMIDINDQKIEFDMKISEYSVTKINIWTINPRTESRVGYVVDKNFSVLPKIVTLRSLDTSEKVTYTEHRL